MNYRVFIASIALFSLAGCGGESNVTTKESKIEKDGLYANSKDLTLMIVDTKQPKTAVMVGDFTTGDIYFNHSYVAEGDTLTTKGLTYVSGGSNFHNVADLKTTIHFKRDSATLTAAIGGQQTIYDFERIMAKKWSKFVGNYTSPNGTVWELNADGTFVITAGCILSGKVEDRDFYYAATSIQVANCSDPTLNGVDYEGRLAIIEHSNKTYIAAAMSNQTGVLWDSLEIGP